MAEKSRSVWGSLYAVVKAFLKDFYTESKRGTLQHRKGIAIFTAFILICFIVIVIGAYKVSETPFFCGLCHNMKVYVDSWKSSSHREVVCIKCHYRPGFMNHLKGKWQDGQLSLVYFVTGKSPTKPHAEIDDASCLQSGCHQRSDLKNDMVFKNVLFSHPRHIEQMKRQKQLRCTTCHSQIVQGAHMTVTDVECFICHFYKTKDQKAYITGCNTCHFEARGDIKVSEAFTFNHKTYVGRGIKCEQCHTTVVSGDGHIPEFACLQCHNKRSILEAKYTPEFLHQNHVTKHKVECFTCHSPIKHQITGLHYKGQETAPCSDCHNGGLHLEKVSMYLGKGAKFVNDRPNRMAAINMDCNVCHSPGNKGPAATCRDCHGDLTNGMLERWKKNLKDGQDELLKEIALAKAASGDKATGALTQVISDAQFNYNFIKKGDGVHNVVYAMQIVEATKKALQAVTGKKDGLPVKADQVSCMKTCHGEIGEKKVSFGSVNFPHAMHIDGEASCRNCHSQYAEHGKTNLIGCSSCHHGEGMGKVRCSDCHRPEEAMFSGKGVKGIGNMPDAMYGKVACTECHTAVKSGKKGNTRSSVKANCVTCHSKDYAGLVDGWIEQDRKLREKYTGSLAALEKDISVIEKQEGRHSVPLRAGLDEINGDTQFLLKGNLHHNPQYAEAIAAKIEKTTAALQLMIKTKKEGRKVILHK
jgi:predicted CXXCH cytochrome family protein